MLVGLTGGIGSGKSTVGKLFEVMGCELISSDVIAKQLYFKPSVKKQVINLLGTEAYLNEHKINKELISQKIFNNTELLHQLNQIIHPEVKLEIAEFVKKHPNQIIIKESALLFEANMDKEVDKIVVVTSGDELRIKRVMERDNTSHEHVLKQIKSQIKQEDKIKKADFVIENNEEISLIEQVLEVMKKLKQISE